MRERENLAALFAFLNFEQDYLFGFSILAGLIIQESKYWKSEEASVIMHMELNNLSRCTGFPPNVLWNFAAQGILPLATPSTDTDQTLFDGQALLRNLVELKNAR